MVNITQLGNPTLKTHRSLHRSDSQIPQHCSKACSVPLFCFNFFAERRRGGERHWRFNGHGEIDHVTNIALKDLRPKASRGLATRQIATFCNHSSEMMLHGNPLATICKQLQARHLWNKGINHFLQLKDTNIVEMLSFLTGSPVLFIEFRS